MWRKEAEGVVTPVVREPAPQQGRLTDEVMHGHQLDRSYAEPFQVLDRGGMRKAGVRSAHGRWHVRMASSETLDVHLVDDGVRPRRGRPWVLAPGEGVGDDD